MRSRSAVLVAAAAHTRGRSGISIEILRLFSGTHSRPFRAERENREDRHRAAQRTSPEVLLLLLRRRRSFICALLPQAHRPVAPTIEIPFPFVRLLLYRCSNHCCFTNSIKMFTIESRSVEDEFSFANATKVEWGPQCRLDKCVSFGDARLSGPLFIIVARTMPAFRLRIFYASVHNKVSSR